MTVEFAEALTALDHHAQQVGAERRLAALEFDDHDPFAWQAVEECQYRLEGERRSIEAS